MDGGVKPGDSLRLLEAKEDLRMDAQFSEYLAAVQAMAKIYGERAGDVPTEFHEEIDHLPEAKENSEFLGV